MLNIIKNLFTVEVTPTARPVLTIDQVQFRRITKRYGKLGTFSTNKGYVMAMRDVKTGRFAKVGA
tara:strand:+ start:373 stop:567 length:195 start_codon:yes stop_codon:yes gene_type:complete